MQDPTRRHLMLRSGYQDGAAPRCPHTTFIFRKAPRVLRLAQPGTEDRARSVCVCLKGALDFVLALCPEIPGPPQTLSRHIPGRSSALVEPPIQARQSSSNTAPNVAERHILPEYGKDRPRLCRWRSSGKCPGCPQNGSDDTQALETDTPQISARVHSSATTSQPMLGSDRRPPDFPAASLHHRPECSSRPPMAGSSQDHDVRSLISCR